MTYSNAGHNPPYLLSPDGQHHSLTNTGIPLGIFPDTTWGQVTVRIDPGGLLLLYTDGVTEAHNQALVAFGETRLLALLQANRSQTAVAIQQAILQTLADFTGAAPQFDDVAIMALRRQS